MSFLQVFGRRAEHARGVLRLVRGHASPDDIAVLRQVREHLQAGRRMQDLPAALAAQAHDILLRLLRTRRAVPVDDVISASGRGFTEPALQREYLAALRRRGMTAAQLPPRQWIQALRRGTVAFRLAELYLGAGFRAARAGSRRRNLGSIPRVLTGSRLDDLVRRLEADLPVLADRLGNMMEEIRALPTHLRRREWLSLNEGHLSILSGNIGEILARQQMLDILGNVQRSVPGAVLLTGARYRPVAGRGPALLFIDGLIAEFQEGTLRVLDRIEIKNMRNADTGIRQHIEAAEIRMGQHEFLGTADEAAAIVESRRATSGGGAALTSGPDLPDAIVLDPQQVRVWDGGRADGITLAEHGSDLGGQYMVATAGPGRRAVSTQTSRRHVIIPGGFDPMGSTSVGVRTGFDLVAGEVTVHHAMGATYDELYHLLAEAVEILKRQHGL